MSYLLAQLVYQLLRWCKVMPRQDEGVNDLPRVVQFDNGRQFYGTGRNARSLNFEGDGDPASGS